MIGNLSRETLQKMAATGKRIEEWLNQFGIPILWNIMPIRSFIRWVRSNREFDIFILGWRGLSLDPDYLKRFFHSAYDVLNQWNYTGYHNKEFDRLAELQAQTLGR